LSVLICVRPRSEIWVGGILGAKRTNRSTCDNLNDPIGK
jgi:hypothetical protein